MNTLGARIKKARGDTSQDAFAKKIQVSKGSLGFYERDENLPNTAVVLKICSVTGVTLEWLMTGNGPMRPGEQPTPQPEATPVASESCSRCAKLEKELDLERSERRELAQENRQLLRENGDLRVQITAQKEALRVLSGRNAAADTA